MAVAPEKLDAITTIFGRKKVLIGNLHCPPLPGSPKHQNASMQDIIKRAAKDAKAYAEGGADGLLIENHGDIPFLKPQDIGQETIAAMSVIAQAVSWEVGLPFGINLLANSAMGALAIAKASGARFVRVNQWVNAYVSNEGFIEGESARALRYRKQIDASDVAIFADVHVKHGSHAIVGDRPISEQAGDVEFYEADVAIVTGNRTGDAVPDEEISQVQQGTNLPVIAGSGVTKDNANRIFSKIDGAIVGSSLKRNGVWWNEVERERVELLVQVIDKLR